MVQLGLLTSESRRRQSRRRLGHLMAQLRKNPRPKELLVEFTPQGLVARGHPQCLVISLSNVRGSLPRQSRQTEPATERGHQEDKSHSLCNLIIRSSVSFATFYSLEASLTQGERLFIQGQGTQRRGHWEPCQKLPITSTPARSSSSPATSRTQKDP